MVMFELPADPRATITEDAGVLRIVMPAGRRWYSVLSMCVWLVAWFLFMIPATWAPRSGDDVAISLLVTALPLLPAAAVLRELLGFDAIEIEGGGLRLRRAIGPVGYTRVFAVSHISNVRYDLESWLGFIRRARYERRTIAFDFEGSTVRFGQDLDAMEAIALAERIRQRCGVPT